MDISPHPKSVVNGLRAVQCCVPRLVLNGIETVHYGFFPFPQDVEQLRFDEKENGQPTRGWGSSLFDRLYYLRGFENLMIDFATDNPYLPGLIEMLTEYEVKLAKQWISMGVDAIWFHTDIGMQDRLMIHPEQFRKYIKPMFSEIFHTCRDAGVHVLLSSDGRLLDIVGSCIFEKEAGKPVGILVSLGNIWKCLTSRKDLTLKKS